ASIKGHTCPAGKRPATGSNIGVKPPNQTGDSCKQDLRQEKTTRGERMTKNKTREVQLPPADKGVNDARPGLPPRRFARTSPGSGRNQRHQTLRDLNSSAQTQHGPSLARPSQSWQQGPQASYQLG